MGPSCNADHPAFRTHVARKLVTAKLTNCVLTYIFMFFAASTFALGIFTVPVESSASPPHALDGVWQKAMSAMHFCAAPIMIISGLYLDSATVPNSTTTTPSTSAPWGSTKTIRIRILSLASILAFCGLSLAASGATSHSSALIFFGVALQSVPLASVYIVGVEMFLAWMPNTPALAVGLVQSAFALGTIMLTPVFDYLIVSLGLVNALYTLAVILPFGALLPALFMRWPSIDELPLPLLPTYSHTNIADNIVPLLSTTNDDDDDHDHHHHHHHHHHNGHEQFDVDKIGWKSLLFMPTFWLYLLTVCTGGASFSFDPYYFKLGRLFGRSIKQLVLMFQITCFMDMMFGLLGTWMADYVAIGTGFFSSGAKNMMMLSFMLQTILFLFMIFMSNGMYYWGFAMIETTLMIIMTCNVGFAALLAKDLFGNKNRAVVYGLGAGLAIGTGEGISAGLMSFVESGKISVTAPNDYNLFYILAACWSFLGWVCVTCNRRLRRRRKKFVSI